MTRTKIIATLGPACDNSVIFKKMISYGVGVARLNFSHGSHPEHIRRIDMIRKLNSTLKDPVRIMQDLEGYRIRIGKLENPVKLDKKETLYLTRDDITGNSREVSFDYRGSLKKIKKGTSIYIDDGKIVLKVKDSGANRLKTQVITGGILKGNKGVNMPDAPLEFPGLTEKDKKDLEVAVKYKLDYIAQSFVRRGEDIRLLRDMLRSRHESCKIFAKVENREALLNIDSIIAEADGIIIARGDLGVCMPVFKVPIIQKQIIKKCRMNIKPVVVATQMLESMVEETIPTRAEVSDIANAILDGADYLLLSSETAMGRHPHKAVGMMDKVIKYTERYVDYMQRFLI